jgi:hypothetical protein
MSFDEDVFASEISAALKSGKTCPFWSSIAVLEELLPEARICIDLLGAHAQEDAEASCTTTLNLEKRYCP